MNLEETLLGKVVKTFELCFFDTYKTQLVGGADEPFYQAPTLDGVGALHFRHNYLRSALHESAHWCHAGLERLKLDDWGYWYEPDGRSESQQFEFYKVEVKPQAIEKGFCEALGVPFYVSVDNLAGPEGPVNAFKKEVELQFEKYRKNGFPKRAKVFIEALKKEV